MVSQYTLDWYAQLSEKTFKKNELKKQLKNIEVEIKIENRISGSMLWSAFYYIKNKLKK